MIKIAHLGIYLTC